ncbi:MAG TPA: MBL fold metallo-hydrolase [Bacteroidia bacterium]|nr:MBL fold metallo-hydrolase [Bacteroidia bacterium]
MKVTFLGTGTSQGIPVIACECEVCQSPDSKDKRLRTSVMVETQGQTFVIDTGPDFRQQMLRENVKNLDAVLFTHSHKDHIAGLDDVRAFNFKNKAALPVYAEPIVQDALRREYHYVFSDEKYPGIPEIELETIGNKPFAVNGVEIIPVRVWHYRLPVLGFRMGDFTYITDANRIDEEEKQKIRGSQVLVLNALRRTEHISHFTLDQAVELAQDLKIPQTYLIHLSHQMGRHEAVEKELPKGISIAWDGLQIFF